MNAVGEGVGVTGGAGVSAADMCLIVNIRGGLETKQHQAALFLSENNNKKQGGRIQRAVEAVACSIAHSPALCLDIERIPGSEAQHLQASHW